MKGVPIKIPEVFRQEHHVQPPGAVARWTLPQHYNKVFTHSCLLIFDRNLDVVLLSTSKREKNLYSEN